MNDTATTEHFELNLTHEALLKFDESQAAMLGLHFGNAVLRKAHEVQCERFGHDWQEIPPEIALHSGIARLCERCHATEPYQAKDEVVV